MEKITSIQVNSGCRLYQDVLKHRFNNVLNLHMPDDFYSSHYKKAVLFFEYVGNNDTILKAIDGVVEQFPKTEMMFVIDDSYEGLITDQFLENLKILLDKHQHITNWLVVSSNKNLKNSIEKIFGTDENFVYFNIHLYLYEYDNVVPSEINYAPTQQLREKKFLCVNRQERVHRLRTVDFLIKKDILKHSFVSCQLGDYAGVLDKNVSFAAQNSKVEKYQDSALSDIVLSQDSKDRLKNTLPLELDIKNYQYRAMANQLPSLESYFDQSYFSIVTEGDFSSATGKNQFTEKVLKCFAFYHPFIVIGLPGTLELLREQGFLTFNSIIDESYDKILNDDKRLNAALAEIEKINRMNINELKNMYDDFFPILEHNYNHLLNIYNTDNSGKVATEILGWYYD